MIIRSPTFSSSSFNLEWKTIFSHWEFSGKNCICQEAEDPAAIRKGPGTTGPHRLNQMPSFVHIHANPLQSGRDYLVTVYAGASPYDFEPCATFPVKTVLQQSSMREKPAGVYEARWKRGCIFQTACIFCA